MDTVAALLGDAEKRLVGCSESPRLDAELLLAQALGKDRTWLFTWPEHVPADGECRLFGEWMRRRERGEPVAHLLGWREFHGHRFIVTADTLIPRPDTETLVEAALQRLPAAQSIAVADLGAGTGAVGISLGLARPDWRVLAADMSPAIVDLIERNCRALGAANVEPLLSSWLDAIDGPLDAIVSNPPYIADGDRHLSLGDVRFEPRSALVSGADGLDDIRQLVLQAAGKLAPAGWLMLEHGHDQGAAVRRLFAEAGYSAVETVSDLGGNERVTVGRKPV